MNPTITHIAVRSSQDNMSPDGAEIDRQLGFSLSYLSDEGRVHTNCSPMKPMIELLDSGPDYQRKWSVNDGSLVLPASNPDDTALFMQGIGATESNGVFNLCGLQVRFVKEESCDDWHIGLGFANARHAQEWFRTRRTRFDLVIQSPAKRCVMGVQVEITVPKVYGSSHMAPLTKQLPPPPGSLRRYK